MGHFLPEALVPLLVDEIAGHCLKAEDAAQSRAARAAGRFAMKRLSFLDALFLYMETPETPMHVASVTIFKPESPQDDLFARFREHVAARLDLLPSYRRRLEATPLGIDHPAWVVEDKIDLDYHIRHAALPKPGGMEELRALIAQLHAVPLDRSRPLWEYHFIEGLEDGAFAVYSRFIIARWTGSLAWRRSASLSILRRARSTKTCRRGSFLLTSSRPTSSNSPARPLAISSARAGGR